ncbi:hypothetical protein PSMA108079_04795 [Pseudoalteromonas mariniglutinosa]
MDKTYLKDAYILSVYDYKDFENHFLGSFCQGLLLTMKHSDFGHLSKW